MFFKPQKKITLKEKPVHCTSLVITDKLEKMNPYLSKCLHNSSSMIIS